MMKRKGYKFIAALLAAGALACSEKGEPLYKDGTYKAEAQGYGGPVNVSLHIKNNALAAIDTEHNETPMLGESAIEALTAQALQLGGWQGLDAVSGATRSSEAFIGAIKTALAEAGEGQPRRSARKQTAAAAPLLADAYDVAIIGAGGAGLAAAVSAARAGASTLVVEKQPMAGGNTLYATGGMNAAGTKYQETLGIQDSPDLFYQDTMKGGYNYNNPALVQMLANQSASALEWLEGLGADLSDVGAAGGASVPRIHRPKGGAKAGPEIVKTLHKAAQDAGVTLAFNTTAIEAGEEDSHLYLLVEAAGRQKRIAAKSIVFATGGFGANNAMVAEYAPNLKGFATTNHKGATGDGISLLRAQGADFVDMQMIQIHPTYVQGKEMVTEGVRGNGAVLVNRSGQRFVNELLTRDVVSKAILNQAGGSAFLVFDQGVRDSLSAIESYVKGGLVAQAPTVGELAVKTGIAAEALEQSVSTYNDYMAKGADLDFGRTHMERPLSRGPYYAIEVTPAVHHTMGGVRIDTRARVLDTHGKPIAGIYAAGEGAGGVHGGNRLGGNALADIVVFGRIAGSEAAQNALAASAELAE